MHIIMGNGLYSTLLASLTHIFLKTVGVLFSENKNRFKGGGEFSKGKGCFSKSFIIDSRAYKLTQNICLV